MSMEYNKNQDKLSDIFKEAREFKILKEENQRLQAQLDKKIHINRKMKRALEKYADPFNDMQPINELAKQVLKEIDNKE